MEIRCLKCSKNINNETGVCKDCFKTFSEYNAWRGMKSRCLNKNLLHYKDYGGRGITICDEWLNSFPKFYEDMGDKPSPDLSLDRADNDGNYCKDNCRWATAKEQTNNRRTRKNNKDHSTGIKGIAIVNNKYRAKYDGYRLGTFTTIEEAQQKIKSYIEQLTLT